MSDPRYVPRDLCGKPGAFGLEHDLPWPDAEDDHQFDLIAASRLQHYYCYLIRTQLAQQGITVVTYARLCGQSYERTAAMLRGAAVMRFDDVARAERILRQIASNDALWGTFDDWGGWELPDHLRP
ncbi:hypothetical protein ACFWH7_16630 [Cellulosimicrobium cellulans]|uniref:hypothetical protein n=1 Tax=Cellulosimicrobium cellulans TaxID=1710 RepID=UPI00365BD32A